MKFKRQDSGELQAQQQKLLLENPAPFVTAQSWVLFDRTKGVTIFGKCESEPRQIASLTKIMTALVVLDTLKSLCFSEWAQLGSEVKILKQVTLIGGTSASLFANDRLTVEDLIYGMMLPSGNDAAQSLAIYIGTLLLTCGQQDPNERLNLQPKEVEQRVRIHSIREAYEYSRDQIVKMRQASK